MTSGDTRLKTNPNDQEASPSEGCKSKSFLGYPEDKEANPSEVAEAKVSLLNIPKNLKKFALRAMV